MTASRVLASGLQALTLIILMRSLGAAHFGQFAAIVAATGIVAVVMGLGLNALALRISAYEDSREVAATIALLRLPVALLSAGVSWSVALFVIGSEASPLLLVAALYAASEAIGEGVEAVLYGSSRHGRAQLTLLARRSMILLGVSAGFVMDDGLMVFATSIILVIVLLGVPLKGVVGHPTSVRRAVKLSRPLWAATVLAKLQTLDVLVAAIALSPASAGVYAAGSRVTSPLNTFAVAALSMLTPRLASLGSTTGASSLFNSSRRAMGLAALALALLSPLVGWLAALAVGPSYEGIFWVATILSCMTAIAALTQVYVSVFYAGGRGPVVAKVRLLVVPVSLALGGLLAYSFGPVALALAMAGSQLMLWFGLAIAHRRW